MRRELKFKINDTMKSFSLYRVKKKKRFDCRSRLAYTDLGYKCTSEINRNLFPYFYEHLDSLWTACEKYNNTIRPLGI